MMCDIKRGGIKIKFFGGKYGSRWCIEVFMHDVRMQLLDVFKWVCPGGGGSSEKGVPYRAQCSSAVEIGGFLLQMDVQGFNCFPS